MPPRHPPYPYVEPVSVRSTLPEIEALIEDFLSQNPDLAINDAGPLDDACRALNVDVEYSHEPNEIMLDVPLDKKPVIWLARNSRPKDDRVTMATGIGFWLMHVPATRAAYPGCGIQALYRPSDTGLMEQAETFAKSLLMPALSFTSLWYEGGGKHAAEILNVPTKMVYERAEELLLTGKSSTDDDDDLNTAQAS